MANTVSNLVPIAFAFYGVLRAHKESLPARYAAAYAVRGQLPFVCHTATVWQGFALVGIGSFAFHATLLFQAQLADELPMIYVVSFGIFVLFDTEPGFSLRSLRSRIFLLVMLAFNFLFSWS
jgi:dihydroceramidase